MSTDKMKIAGDAYASFARGDLPGFFANFDENSLLIEAPSLPYGGDHRGPEGGTKALMQIGGAWTDIQYDLVDMVAGEKIVVAYGIFSATSRKSGKKVSMPLAEVWEFNGDKVKSVTPLYFDTAAAAEALA